MGVAVSEELRGHLLAHTQNADTAAAAAHQQEARPSVLPDIGPWEQRLVVGRGEALRYSPVPNLRVPGGVSPSAVKEPSVASPPVRATSCFGGGGGEEARAAGGGGDRAPGRSQRTMEITQFYKALQNEPQKGQQYKGLLVTIIVP